LFTTVIVYVTLCPRFADDGPDFVMLRFACAPTFVVALALSSFVAVSFVVVETVAVFVTLPLKLGDVL
jgi:hypothetical protein